MRRLRHWAVLLLPGVVMLLFWQWASGRLIRPVYVSRPTDIAARLVDLFATGEIWPNLAVTGQELVLGYLAGVVTGVLAGVLLGRAPRAARVIEPYLMGFYGIPKIALAPLFVIWFGIGLWSKVALAGTMVFFLVFYNVYAGMRTVDRDLVNLVAGAGRLAPATGPPRLPAGGGAVHHPGHAHGDPLRGDRRHRGGVHVLHQRPGHVHQLRQFAPTTRRACSPGIAILLAFVVGAGAVGHPDRTSAAALAPAAGHVTNRKSPRSRLMLTRRPCCSPRGVAALPPGPPGRPTTWCASARRPASRQLPADLGGARAGQLRRRRACTCTSATLPGGDPTTLAALDAGDIDLAAVGGDTAC